MQREICVRMHFGVITSSRIYLGLVSGRLLELLHIEYSLEGEKDIHRLDHVDLENWVCSDC